MLTSFLLAAAILAVPAVLVVALLIVLGTGVAGMADGSETALARPNPA